ncbi:hypothetical protein AZE42_11809 [Rhizopogon vesiculosus]|uniref:Uncharacterized protein n=1 Tax=Rhizopogon vesiculosus TaxID=180088 RepID=A0A1J8Q7B4_9AGAM|nr:hypothetical protein AZE42_11809 [Rhizopogon vesiculosus]
MASAPRACIKITHLIAPRSTEERDGMRDRTMASAPRSCIKITHLIAPGSAEERDGMRGMFRFHVQVLRLTFFYIQGMAVAVVHIGYPWMTLDVGLELGPLPTRRNK